MKYQVFFDGTKFHLSKDRRETFCGKSIKWPKFSESQYATAQEFVMQVRPRCRSCNESALIIEAIAILTED